MTERIKFSVVRWVPAGARFVAFRATWRLLKGNPAAALLIRTALGNWRRLLFPFIPVILRWRHLTGRRPKAPRKPRRE